MENVIYLLRNKVNSKIYIGMTSQLKRRLWEHKCSVTNKSNKRPIVCAIREFGIESFESSVLEVVNSKSELPEREIYWIEKLKPEYNVSTGGIGNRGYTHTDEAKKRLSMLSKIQWENLSEDQKQKRVTNNLKGPKKGHNVSLETRQKIREKLTGRPLDEYHKKRISDSLKGKPRPNKGHYKKVKGVSLDGSLTIEANSIKEASALIKMHPSNITSALKGRQKSAGGFIWQYVV